MDAKNILILEITAGGGHLSISQAIIEALNQSNPQYTCVRSNISFNFIDKYYGIISQKYVNLFSLFFKATEMKSSQAVASQINRRIFQNKIKKEIEKHQPIAIISNTQLATKEIPDILKRNNLSIPFFVFIPDPITPHEITFSPLATHTFVATTAAFQKALQAGVPPQKITITGHPIRQRFYSPPKNKNTIYLKYHLNSKKPIILFGGSGEGTDKTLEILLHLGATPTEHLLKQLLRSTTDELRNIASRFLNNPTPQSIKVPPFQALFITGKNKQLKKQLEQLTFPQQIKPTILGFIEDMPSLVHMADLVVGKAGPNILFETCAAHKPFLATYHIKGQEDGNLEIIRGTGCGFVAERPENAAKLIASILAMPSILNYTKPGIELISGQNKLAAEKITKIINQHL